MPNQFDNDWLDAEVAEAMRLKRANVPTRKIAAMINKTVGQVAGMTSRTQKSSQLHQGAAGVIERQSNDRSRITLINIPSIAEAQAQTAYSYIARDQMFGKKTKGRRSAVG